MKNIIFISMAFAILNICCSHQALTSSSKKKGLEDNPIGFVFVDISGINAPKGTVSILDMNKDTVLDLRNQVVSLNGSDYKINEEGHIYRRLVNTEVFEPEYGLFILKCYETTNKFYKVELNGRIALINNNPVNEYVQFKSIEQYIMETYPVPTEQNPLRIAPDESAGVVNNFDKWVYSCIEIDGDWVKIIDDKDCYRGEAPSPVDIKGWIRWRKDGKFILKVAHTC